MDTEAKLVALDQEILKLSAKKDAILAELLDLHRQRDAILAEEKVANMHPSEREALMVAVRGIDSSEKV